MPEAAIGLRLEIELEPDADPAELEFATTQLRQELMELDVDRVDFPAGAPPPADTRGLEMAALGTLLVGAGRAAIGPITQAIQSWVARRSQSERQDHNRGRALLTGGITYWLTSWSGPCEGTLEGSGERPRD
jgi:hypothetical protein